MSDIIQRLKNIVEGDHSRGCRGRECECTCGFDHETLLVTKEAIVLLELANAWVEARLAVVNAPVGDPTFKEKLNRLSEAEDALCRRVRA